MNLIILTDFHSLTVNEEKLLNQSIFKISAKVRVGDFGQNLIWLSNFTCVVIYAYSFVSTNSIQFEVFCQGPCTRVWSKFENDENLSNLFHSSRKHLWIMFTFEFDHLHWLSQFWKWLKLLKSVPFIKQTLVNQVYIRIRSFWLTFTVLQWIKKNSKIIQFWSFLLWSSRVCDLGQNLIMTKTS